MGQERAAGDPIPPGHARIELTDGSDLDATLGALGWGAYADALRDG